MSGVFIDGGGHEALSHGGEGIDHGGHGSHAVHHVQGQGGHSFLSQILGLDQHDHAHLAHHGGEAGGQSPSQTPSWNSALQGLKLENLVAGINITPNHLLCLLFASFVGWLGVIYWIRHHEPFANQVLGSSAAFAPTAGADRRLINDCRDALPLKTSAQSGIVYSPQPGQNTSIAPSGSQVNTGLSAAMASAFGQTPAPAVASTAGPYAQPSNAYNQSYSAAPVSYPLGQSPVNQGLSSAMSAALGSSQVAAAPTQSSAPQYSQAPPSYPLGSMPGQMSGPTGGGGGSGSMRLFSSRNAGGMQGGTGQTMSQSSFAPPMASGRGMRLFSSRRSMMAAAPVASPQTVAPVPQPTYASPAVNPNTWSLANQGVGQFSSDTAQFDSQFGAPLPSSSFGTLGQSGMNAAAYPITTPDGTRLKVVTDK